METLAGLRSQGEVSVTQGSGFKKEMPRHPVSPKEVLFLFKVSKMTYFNYDSFKVSKICILLGFFYLVLMHMYIFL